MLKNDMRLILFAVLVIMVGCNKSAPVDCAAVNCLAGDNLVGNFQIMNSDNGNLLFGSGHVYDPESILFYSVNGSSDTTFYPGVKKEWGIADSVLSVDLSSKPSILFVRLNSFDTDTLRVSYRRTEAGPCCGAAQLIDHFVLNGTDQVIPGAGSNVIIK
jgi:hypothetical protein